MQPEMRYIEKPMRIQGTRFFVINCFISETTSYNIYKHNTFYNTQVHVKVSHTTKYESLGVTLSIKDLTRCILNMYVSSPKCMY